MVNLTKTQATWESRVFGIYNKTLTRTPVTKTLDNVSGSETLTEGTPDATYTGVFFRKEDMYKMDNPGLFQDADAILLVKVSQTLNKDDKITFDSQNYRVFSVVTRYQGSVAFHKVAQLFKC